MLDWAQFAFAGANFISAVCRYVVPAVQLSSLINELVSKANHKHRVMMLQQLLNPIAPLEDLSRMMTTASAEVIFKGDLVVLKIE